MTSWSTMRATGEYEMRGSLIKQHSLMVHVALSPFLMIQPFYDGCLWGFWL